ncbi:MAG: LamG-like jellyroll fold domain-containing protein [Candidatus Hodarchaeota archaeon]
MKLLNKITSFMILFIVFINVVIIVGSSFVQLNDINEEGIQGQSDTNSLNVNSMDRISHKDSSLSLEEERLDESQGARRASSGMSIPGWADKSYLYRKNITLDPSAGFTSLTNFPVLIDLYDSDLQQYCRADGWDIMFTDDKGNQLDFEIELFDRMYNSTKAHLVAWVKTDLSPVFGTTISMYFGKSVTANQENIEILWTDYEAVWHLSESEGSGNYIEDSTGNGYDGTPSGTQFLESGISAGARNFTGSNNRITMDNGGNLFNGWGSFMFSFWIYPDFPTDAIWESESEREVFYKENSLRMARLYRQTWHNPGKGNFQSDIDFVSSGTSYVAVTINRQQWNHITYAYDGNNLITWINGVMAGNSSIGSDNLVTDSSIFYLGTTGGNPRSYIDEFRIAQTPKSADWIATEFDNQLSPNDFYVMGTKEDLQVTEDWGATLARYRKKITLDHTKVSGNLTNFPVLIDLYDSDLHDSEKVQSDGDDIMFYGEEQWDWSNNLMSNPGFEQGSLTGWVVSGNWAVGLNPPLGYTDPQNGIYCAYVSSDGDPTDYIQQDIDIATYATDIDNERAILNASGWLVSSEDGYDNSTMKIQYLNNLKNVISTPLDTGYPFPSDWMEYSVVNDIIPANTRYIRVWASTYE